MNEALPIDPHVGRSAPASNRHRARGAGRRPGRGQDDARAAGAGRPTGRVLVLQPRRVAARAIARAHRGGARLDARPRGRLAGALRAPVHRATRGCSSSPRASSPRACSTTRCCRGVATVVLDEFHERSLHADLGAGARAPGVAGARPTCALVVMSATLDAGAGGALPRRLPGRRGRRARRIPLSVEYAPGESVADAVRDVLPRTARPRAVLPARARARSGARAELRVPRLGRRRGRAAPRLLAGDAQDARARGAAPAARDPGDQRRRDVAHRRGRDGGRRHRPGTRCARYDADARPRPARRSSGSRRTRADQRAGRAGRTRTRAACVRLWDARDRLRAARASPRSRASIWPAPCSTCSPGAPIRATFEWFEAPPPDALDAALALLERLGAVRRAATAAVTPLGAAAAALAAAPAPRAHAARGRGAPERRGGVRAARRGRGPGPGRRPTTTCDLLADLDRFAAQPLHVRQVRAASCDRLARGALEAPRAARRPRTACGGRCSPASRSRRAPARAGLAAASRSPRATARRWRARAACATASSWSRSTSRRRAAGVGRGAHPPGEPRSSRVAHADRRSTVEHRLDEATGSVRAGACATRTTRWC